PFDFDVHAMFFAADAVTVLDTLHRHLADRRVNLVNARREFFRATALEVFDALATHRIGVAEFRTRPGATEYRTSLEMAEAR
ncbi:MAG: GIY-YIG nuclease family protein, partial [Micrococcales bacterium]|nr:GIY-YIG nuclease family protein [Micrococcales bacterium]